MRTDAKNGENHAEDQSTKTLASMTPADVGSPPHLEACRRGHERERQQNPRAVVVNFEPNTGVCGPTHANCRWQGFGGNLVHVRRRVAVFEVEGLSPPISLSLVTYIASSPVP